MLQSLNYYKNVSCPDTTCTRPYCQFKHCVQIKTQKSITNEELTNKTSNHNTTTTTTTNSDPTTTIVTTTQDNQDSSSSNVDNNNSQPELLIENFANAYKQVEGLIKSCDSTLPTAIHEFLSKTLAQQKSTSSKSTEFNKLKKCESIKSSKSMDTISSSLNDVNNKPASTKSDRSNGTTTTVNKLSRKYSLNNSDLNNDDDESDYDDDDDDSNEIIDDDDDDDNFMCDDDEDGVLEGENDEDVLNKKRKLTNESQTVIKKTKINEENENHQQTTNNNNNNKSNNDATTTITSKQNEMKLLLQEKREAIIRKMNIYKSSGAVPSTIINRQSLQQQIQRRNEIIKAQQQQKSLTTTTNESQTTKNTSTTTSNTQQNAAKKPAVLTPKLILDSTNKVPFIFRQRYLNFIFDELKKQTKNIEEACDKASQEEKSLYDRAKTKPIYSNLAVNLIKNLRAQSQKTTPAIAATPKTPTKPATTTSSTTTTASSSSSTITTTVKASPVAATSKKLVNTTIASTTKAKVHSSTATTSTTKTLVNGNKTTTTKFYSHDAIVSSSTKQSSNYSINRKKILTIKDLSPLQLYNMFKKYALNEQQLLENCFPLECVHNPQLAYIPKSAANTSSNNKKVNSKYSLHLVNGFSENKTCKRCGKNFKINKNYEYLSNDDCVYHWGKLRQVKVTKSYIEKKYSCCSQDSNSDGCQVSKHVYDGDEYENNEPLTGFVKTVDRLIADTTKPNIYALDCEMCHTTKGLELTRISVIDTDLNVVYETIVLPDYQIIDYNTRWSGLTEQSFRNCTIKLSDVQKDLLNLFNKDTILIGHSLESDFKALKLIHKTVVDTSVVFPHRAGPPFKRALRNLMSEHLQKIIQEDANGHDSKEDACSCMELMLWKIEQDLRSL